jgi:hypothetical protein
MEDINGYYKHAETSLMKILVILCLFLCCMFVVIFCVLTGIFLSACI